jgi:hypothetical protein
LLNEIAAQHFGFGEHALGGWFGGDGHAVG